MEFLLGLKIYNDYSITIDDHFQQVNYKSRQNE